MRKDKVDKVHLYKDIFDRYVELGAENSFNGVYNSGEELTLIDKHSVFLIPVDKVRNRKSLGLDNLEPSPLTGRGPIFLDDSNFELRSANLPASSLDKYLIREETAANVFSYYRKLSEYECRNKNEVRVGDCISHLKLGRSSNCSSCTSNSKTLFTRVEGFRKFPVVEAEETMGDRSVFIGKDASRVRYHGLANDYTFSILGRMFEEVDVYHSLKDRKLFSEVMRKVEDASFLFGDVMEAPNFSRTAYGFGFAKFSYPFEDGSEARLVSAVVHL